MAWWRKDTESEAAAKRAKDEERRLAEEQKQDERLERARKAAQSIFDEQATKGVRFVDIRWNELGFGDDNPDLWDFVDIIVDLANEHSDKVESISFYNVQMDPPYTRGAILTMNPASCR
jgi:hypothetical protein